MFFLLAASVESKSIFHHHHHPHRHFFRDPREPEEVSNASGQQIANTALSKKGCAYVYGAAGPNTFDCSGLTSWAHKQHGINIPRTASQQQKGGKSGSGAVGDVICFGSPAYHVGICTGSGNFVHAPHTGDVVKVTAIKYMSGPITYRRYW